jgi:hypothetical protein
MATWLAAFCNAVLCDVNMSSDVLQGKAKGMGKVFFVLVVCDSSCPAAFELDLLYAFASGGAVKEIN